MANKEVKTNPQYKDRLFRKIFGGGDNESKRNILSLYNALNNTEYNDICDLEITTMDDAIYIKMKNDVSFLIDSYLSLWEHQSTYNPNMPLRGLMYFGNLYNEYIATRKLNIYGKTLVEIPNPKYIVFYNGNTDTSSIEDLKLSSAFKIKDDTGDFEWTAKMYNLNRGKNDSLLAKCKPLADYMELVNRIRDNQNQGMTTEEAVNKAIDDCIKDGIMVDYLSKMKSEVMDVVITEYNEETFVNGIRSEGLAEGLAKGEAQKALQVYKNCIARGMSKEDAIAISEIKEDEIPSHL